MSLEKRLLENMLRFGSKNLTEYDQRILKRMLQEQATPTTAAPAAATPAAAAPAATTDKWGVPGFTYDLPVNSVPEISENTKFCAAYETYLDNASGWVGKTVIVFKDKYVDAKDIVDRFVVKASYAYTGTTKEGQRPVKFWTTKQPTRNYDIASGVMIVNSDAEPQDDGSYYLALGAIGSEGSFSSILAPANVGATLEWREEATMYSGQYFGSTPYSINIYNSTDLMNTGTNDYSIDWEHKVYRSGKFIGYSPVTPYNKMPAQMDGYGMVLTTKGKSVKLQDEKWAKTYLASKEPQKKKK